MSRRVPWCWLALALAPTLALAQPLTLKDAARNAVLNNPEVLSRWHTFKAAESERDAASGAFLPRLDLTAGVGREKRDDPLLQLGYTRNSTSLTLTQMLYDGFATLNDVKRLDHARLLRALEIQDSADSVALEAARAYLDVLRFRTLVGRAEENYVVHRSMFEQIQSKAQAGVARRVDLEQAAGRLALAEANLLTESSNLHDVSARFQRIVGEVPAKEMESLPKLSQDIPAEAEAAIKLAQAGNPALRASIENVRSAINAAEARRAAYQPRLDLRLSTLSGNDLNGYTGSHHTNVAEVVLNWNLFNGMSDVARSRQYAEQANVARDLRDKTCRDVRQTLAIAYNDVRKLNEQLTYLDQHQLSIEKARDAYRKQFDIGQRTLLDLLDTENELFQARRAYANAEYDLAIAYVRTHAGMGRLLPALGVSAKEATAPLAELEQWDAATDAPVQCPPEAVKMYTADKGALNARAQELLRESAPARPVAPPVAPAATDASVQEVGLALKAWTTAWKEHQIDAYLGMYTPDFVPAGGGNHEAWAAKRRQTVGRAGEISLDLADIKIEMRDAQHATTTFRQSYRAANYSDTVAKTMEWTRINEKWLIARETTAPK